MTWYLAKDGKQIGPLSEAEASGKVKNGEVGPEDLAWTEAFGDQWRPIRGVAALCAAVEGAGADEAVAPVRNVPPGLTPNDEIAARARAALRGNWAIAVAVGLVYNLIVSGVAHWAPDGVGAMISLLITGPMMLGAAFFFLGLARRGEADFSALFRGYRFFAGACIAGIAISVLVLLGALVFIVPGVMLALSWSMTFFIMADNPQLGGWAAMQQSAAMMKGHKGKLLGLWLAFFGWGIVCLLTFGIGFLWLWPYMQTAFACFYEDVRC